MLVDAVVAGVGSGGSVSVSLNPTSADDCASTRACAVPAHIPMPKKGDSGYCLCSGLDMAGALTPSSRLLWMGAHTDDETATRPRSGKYTEAGNFHVHVDEGGVNVGGRNGLGIDIKDAGIRLQSPGTCIVLAQGGIDVTGTDTNSRTSFRFVGAGDGTVSAYCRRVRVGTDNGIAVVGGAGAAFTFTGAMDADFDAAAPARFFGVKAQHMQFRASGPLNFGGTGAYFKVGGSKLISKSRVGFAVDSLDGDIILQTGAMGDIKVLTNTPTAKIAIGCTAAGIDISPIQPMIVLTAAGVDAGAPTIKLTSSLSTEIETELMKIDTTLLQIDATTAKIAAELTQISGVVKLDGGAGSPTGFCCIGACLLTGAPQTTNVHLGA